MLAARRSLSHWPHVTRKREVRTVLVCLPPPSVFLSLSRSPRSASLPSRRAPRLPSERYLALSRARSLRHFLVNYRARGRRLKGEEFFTHTHTRARARARRALFESALRAGFSRISSRGNSAGNVEREPGIAVAPLFLPSRYLHSLLPLRPRCRRRRCCPPPWVSKCRGAATELPPLRNAAPRVPPRFSL